MSLSATNMQFHWSVCYKEVVQTTLDFKIKKKILRY